MAHVRGRLRRIAFLASPNWLFRRETLLLAATFLLAAAAALAAYALRPTTLTIAVAPKNGSEPVLIRAFGRAIAARRTDLRLQVQDYPDVGDSAHALETGKADLAVVRLDERPPTNGLVVAVLRDQALLVASPGKQGIGSYVELAGKKLGIIAPRPANVALLRTVLGYYGLTFTPGRNLAADRPERNQVLFYVLPPERVEAALRMRQVDAVAAVTAPVGQRARAMVGAVAAAGGGEVTFAGVEDVDALTKRFPRLQDVTLPPGLFGGRPRVPAEEQHVVGTAYLLVARNTLSRSVVADVTQQLFELRPAYAAATEAASYVRAPDYETSAEATSAQVPLHPGAVDYYDREQETFVDRYGDYLYLLFFAFGGLGSVVAWLQHRIALRRREEVDVALDRLAAIVAAAGKGVTPEQLRELAREVERLSITTIRDVRRRGGDMQAFAAVEGAVGSARAALAEARA